MHKETTLANKSSLLGDKRILFFTAAVVLFHFANAAMLPLLGQKLSEHHAPIAQSLMAACIIIAQLTMVPVAFWAGRQAVHGRRGVMLVGFAILPIRGLLFTLTDNSAFLLANQVLDGVGAGIYGVASVLIIADLTRGTGRFNCVLGMVATAIGFGAALRNLLTGVVVDAWGYSSGFQFLGVIALLALFLF